MVQMKKVESSNLEAIGYDDVDRSLYIDFNSGGRYQYLDVLPHIYPEILDAESPGSYFRKFVMEKFKHNRIK